MIDESFYDTPNVDPAPVPSYSETLNVVSDALVEVQADNAALAPDCPRRVCEDTFIIGAVTAYMGHLAPVGPAMARMSSVIKNYADNHRYNDRKRA